MLKPTDNSHHSPSSTHLLVPSCMHILCWALIPSCPPPRSLLYRQVSPQTRERGWFPHHGSLPLPFRPHTKFPSPRGPLPAPQPLFLSLRLILRYTPAKVHDPRVALTHAHSSRPWRQIACEGQGHAEMRIDPMPKRELAGPGYVQTMDKDGTAGRWPPSVKLDHASHVVRYEQHRTLTSSLFTHHQTWLRSSRQCAFAGRAGE